MRRNLPNLHFRNRLADLFLMLFLSLLIFLNRILVFENIDFFFNRSKNCDWFMDLKGDEILQSLSFITLLFYFLPVLVSLLDCLLVFHSLNQFISWRSVTWFFRLSSPYLFEIFWKNFFLFTIKLIHKLQEWSDKVSFSLDSLHSIFWNSIVEPSKPIRKSKQSE